jgi:hypothetical protein
MIIDNLNIFSWFKKGHWVNTKYRGWLKLEVYYDYLSYNFDPKFIEDEIY